MLHCFSKIPLKVIYVRLYKFLYKHNILCSNQFGVRTNHSTNMSILQFAYNLTQAIDNENYTVGIFAYLSKAFDTVAHNILLCELSHFGIRGIAFDWSKAH